MFWHYTTGRINLSCLVSYTAHYVHTLGERLCRFPWDRRVALGCVFLSLRFQAEWGRASALKRRRRKQEKQNKAECNSAIPEYASGFTAGLIASMIS